MSGRRRAVHLGDGAVLLIIVAVFVALFVPSVRSRVGELFDGPAGSAPWSAPADPVAALPSSEAATQLAGLPVRTPEESRQVPEYHRTAFGQAWADEDHNGCDTRNDVLGRDLARPVFKPGTRDCVVVSGTLAEPYTGSVVEFQRGPNTSDLVQIDHVVALGDAWRSGAWTWDAARRQQFANDQANLFAVDGHANQDKGASAADQWLPANRDFQCRYATTQISVKSTWGLSVTEAERTALASALATCP